MYLICGLGNPGNKYMNTRHNIGFQLVEKIIANYNFKITKKDKNKELYSGYIGKHKCILLKSLNFMNLTGSVVCEISSFYKIKNSNLIIIHDDIDLKLSKVKIKIGGGNGGHNGLKNIDSHIGKDYIRVRVGISHPRNKSLVPSYVLKKFTKEEEEIIENKLNMISRYFNIIFTDKSLFLTRIVEI